MVFFGVVLLVLPLVAAAGWYWFEPWSQRIGLSREKRTLVLVLAAFGYGVLLYGYHSKVESDHQDALDIQQKSMLGDPLNPPYLDVLPPLGNRDMLPIVLSTNSQYAAFNVGIEIRNADNGWVLYEDSYIGEIYPFGTARRLNRLDFRGQSDIQRLKVIIRTRIGVYSQRLWLIKENDGSWTRALIVTDDSGKTLLEDAYPGFPRNDNGEIEWFD